MGSLKHGTPKTPHFNSGRTRTRPCVHCGVFFFDNEKLLNHERSHEEDKNGNDQKTPHFNSGRTRTRPCVYCGAFFFDQEKLLRHEETEAEKFKEEREKIQRENPNLAGNEQRSAQVNPIFQK